MRELGFLLLKIPTDSRYCERLTAIKTRNCLLNRSEPAGIYLFKVKNGNTRTVGEFSSNLTIKTPEQRQYNRLSVFIVNFEQISHTVLVFPLLMTLNFTFRKESR